MEDDIGPCKPHRENSTTSKEVKFVIHGAIGPTTCKPETSNELKDVSSPIDEGRSPEKPGAPRPRFFRDLRLLTELGIAPEKLVPPISKFSRLLSAEKFGRVPDKPGIW
jgi:hypothetical protein